MKLILHSDQSHHKTAETDATLIRSLSGKRNPRIGYIPSTPDPRRKYFTEKQNYYSKMGFSDFNDFDPGEDHSEEDVAKFLTNDVIHLSGGQVCVFMDRLRDSGFDSALKGFAQRGGVIVGVSAGAMILGQTFQTAALFKERGRTDGLGLFDFEIVPHVSDHFPRMDVLQAFAKKIGKTIYALNDGDVLVLSGQKIRFCGSPVKIEPVTNKNL